MMQGFFISAPTTGVGKTEIALALIRCLNDRFVVRVRKPTESGATEIDGILQGADARVLAAACRKSEALEVVCPYPFAPAANTEFAAQKSGRSLELADLVSACRKNTARDFVIVEGAGGLCSPIASKALNIDLAAALGLPVLLVVKDALGAISEALLCIFAALQRGVRIHAIILNQIRPNHLENAEQIHRYGNIPVIRFDKKNPQKFCENIQRMMV